VPEEAVAVAAVPEGEEVLIPVQVILVAREAGRKI